MTNLRGGFTPPMPARPATGTDLTLGRRVVLLDVDDTGRSRHLRGYRVVSEVVTTDDATPTVLVAAERDWHAWTIGARPALICPNARRWPTTHVHLDDDHAGTSAEPDPALLRRHREQALDGQGLSRRVPS